MTEATSIAARWFNTPRTIEPEEGYGPNVWKVDSVRARLLEDGKLQIESIHRGWSAGTPDMRFSVYDGELRVPLEDLVPQVLQRMDLNDMAQMICADSEARRSILSSLAADRRYWLAKVKEAIHDAKLDALTYAMTRIEHAAAQMGYRAMADIAYENVLAHALIDAGIDRKKAFEQAERRYQPNQSLVDMKREQVKTLFANVVVPDEPATAL